MVVMEFELTTPQLRVDTTESSQLKTVRVSLTRNSNGQTDGQRKNNIIYMHVSSCFAEEIENNSVFRKWIFEFMGYVTGASHKVLSRP